MDSWADSRQTLELQEVAGHLGSAIQQLYYTTNSIPNGTMKIYLDIPSQIENHAYTTTLLHVPNSYGAYRIMNISIRLSGTESATYTIVTLGDNIDWAEGLSFNSYYNQSNPLSFSANKTANNIWLTCGGV